jgi:hypothetical protein
MKYARINILNENAEEKQLKVLMFQHFKSMKEMLG